MSSKLRRAIGAVKDRTSISLARLSSGSPALDVAVLRATSHDESPVDDRRATEVVLLASSSPAASADLVVVLSRRLSRTRNWVVALKSLSLAFLALRDASPHFPREALAASRRPSGPRLLDLSSFSDETSGWHFSAYVRTFALFLETRLDCFLFGKLLSPRRRRSSPVISMKPDDVLNYIRYWQQLLDRAIGMRPTGPARNNRLVLICLYPVVRESLALYRDLADGLCVLLDKFFSLDARSRLDTFQAVSKAEKQFIELDAFFKLCMEIGVGRKSEYPSVGRISTMLLETMEEFLKDEQATAEAKAQQSPDLQRLLSKQMGHFEGQEHASEQLASTSTSKPASMDGGPEGWELVLVESATDIAKKGRPESGEGLKSSCSMLWSSNNPFLSVDDDDGGDGGRGDGREKRRLGSASMSLPTFRTERSYEKLVPETEDSELFTVAGPAMPPPADRQQQLLMEKEQWMRHQNKIIARNT